MDNVKRIEIIIDAPHAKQVLDLLRRIGVSGYTVIRGVTGSGERGVRANDELTDVFSNTYVITACNAALATKVMDALRPVLKANGGVCLVSDAQWLKH
jgi:nitrogen regulatory protein PII